MGGVSSALHEDAFAAHFNPAGLQGIGGFSSAVSFVRPYPFLGGNGHSFAGAAYTFGRLGTLAVSSDLYWMGPTDVVSNMGEPLGRDNQNFHWHGKISFAGEPKPGLHTGLSLGYLRYDADSHTSTGESVTTKSGVMTIDAGVLADELLPQTTFESNFSPSEWRKYSDRRVHRGFRVAAALRNWSASKVAVVDEDQADPMPTSLVAGFMHTPFVSDLFIVRAGTDAEMILYEKGIVHFLHWGAEVKCLQLVAVRCGYVQDVQGPISSYWTWGFGLVTRFGSINIARYERTFAPVWHIDGIFRLSMTGE